MTKAQKKALRAEKLKAAKAILDLNPQLTAEQEAQVTALTNEAKTLKAEIDSSDSREAMASEIDAELAAADVVPAPRSGPASTSQPAPAPVARPEPWVPQHG